MRCLFTHMSELACLLTRPNLYQPGQRQERRAHRPVARRPLLVTRAVPRRVAVPDPDPRPPVERLSVRLGDFERALGPRSRGWWWFCDCKNTVELKYQHGKASVRVFTVPGVNGMYGASPSEIGIHTATSRKRLPRCPDAAQSDKQRAFHAAPVRKRPSRLYRRGLRVEDDVVECNYVVLCGVKFI